jgi:hypothetical protein
MTERWILAAAAALLISPAAAEDDYPYTPERLAQVYENETAGFDAQSIRDRAGVRMFDVRISANNPAAMPSGASTSRTVRYFARCQENEMAVGGIAMMDSAGRLIRSVMVPPGAWEYFKPEGETNEAEWLERACSRY